MYIYVAGSAAASLQAGHTACSASTCSRQHSLSVLTLCMPGQVYTVSIRPGFPATSPAMMDEIHGDVALTFVCDPDKAHALVDQALEEIARLQVSLRVECSH